MDNNNNNRAQDDEGEIEGLLRSGVVSDMCLGCEQNGSRRVEKTMTGGQRTTCVHHKRM
jgi:hypothetical protein